MDQHTSVDNKHVFADRDRRLKSTKQHDGRTNIGVTKTHCGTRAYTLIHPLATLLFTSSAAASPRLMEQKRGMKIEG